jgi:hypothetical protein
MKFHYYLDNDAGWAVLIFEDKNVSLNFCSCMRDSLNQLLSGIIGIIGSETQIYSIEDSHRDFAFKKNKFEWIIDQVPSNVKYLLTKIDEPEIIKHEFKYNVKFIFSKINDSKLINIKIIKLDVGDKERECVYNDNIVLNELINNILFSCSEILRKYGIIGYSRNFQVDFPIVYYLILKDFIKNEIKFDRFTGINITEKVDMFRSDLSKEIEYLNGVN